MATTWNLLSVVHDAEVKAMTVQEVVDTVPGKTYTAHIHSTGTIVDLKARLKTIINADRTKQGKDNTFKSKIDLTNFETFLNT